MNGGVNLTTLAVGGGAIGLLIGAWGYIKSYLEYIWKIVFITHHIHNQSGSIPQLCFLRYLNDNFKKSPLRGRHFLAWTDFVRPKNKNQIVAWERQLFSGETYILRKGWRFLVVKGEGSQLSLTFIRGLFDIEKMFKESIKKYNDNNNDEDWKKYIRFRIVRKSGSIGSKSKDHRDLPDTPKAAYGEGSKSVESSCDIDKKLEPEFNLVTPLDWKKEEIGQPFNQSAFNTLYYTENIQDMIQETLLWRKSEQWFKARNIPYKRGYLFAGKPGTGKSAFVRALGQELNMPIVVFDLATMSNNDFTNAWEYALEMAPCIALFEDFDAIFEGRKNVTSSDMEHGLTFDCFLNTMDGVNNTEGILKIITTNEIEKIDPAIGNVSNGDEMSTRPGRIDRVVYFGSLTEEGKEKMAQRILGDFPRETWNYVFDKGKNDTGAQFQERCCRVALNLFWKNKEKSSQII